MNKLLGVLCVLVLVAIALPCYAAVGNGVVAKEISLRPDTTTEERVVNLPQDAGKWYVSVVGDAGSARYKELLGWFDTSAKLKKLKNQVHFCPVTSNTAIFKDRYAKNILGLPTVRLQKSDGTIVFEAAGKNIPATAEELNTVIATAVASAQGIRPLLPWRRDMENRCTPGPQPEPQPQPKPEPNSDPAPQPLDDNGAPNMDSEPQADLPLWALALLVNGGLLVGLAAGYGGKLVAKLRSNAK
jgi:hypothetical protein